ncbi:Na/Pi symporter [Metallumcola ferriviriculae]|uniref:Na/Pi symporter n=1 Tax=Metallumcola ferriviriculae TaxID=3039180 RepID=A0AAU0UNP0_9FIRM|nr:Na/Pi symporter [Desulfitibacteraceae bacterium MK1]
MRLVLFPFGLLVFFIGMYLMRQGLSSIWEQSIKHFLYRVTATPLRGLLLGAGATAVMQSSSAVTVITMGMIDGKLLPWASGLGIILGTNIGTCTTAQFLSIHLESYWWLISLSGLLISLKYSWKSYGFPLIGLGIVLGSMSIMTWSVQYLQHLWRLNQSISILEGVLWGLVITAIIQSSSAFMVMIIALGVNGVIGLEQAFPLILGSNLGTCVTAGLASIGGSPGSRKIFYSHLLLNLLGIFAFLPLLPALYPLLTTLTSDPGKQIAAGHTLYNVICSVAALPFTRLFASFLSKLPPIDRQSSFN